MDTGQIFFSDSQRKRFLKKIISGALSLVFMLFSVYTPDIAYAKVTNTPASIDNTQILLNNIDSVPVPKANGTIRELHRGPNGKLIVHIQDAHVNYEGQKNLAGILKNLIEKYGINLVLVEGGTGDVGLSFLRHIGTKRVREEVANKYLKKGKIAGEEYLDIVSDPALRFKLFGIEDKELYRSNIDQFIKIDGFSNEANSFLGSINNGLSILKDKHYSKALKEFEKKTLAYEEDTLDMADYCKYLTEKTELKNKSEIDSILRVKRLEDSIDFDNVNNERDAYLSQLSKDLPKDQLTMLLKSSVDFKAGLLSPKDFYLYIKALGLERGIDIKEYPNLHVYTYYIKVFEDINHEKLFNQLESLKKDKRTSLCKNNTQKRLTSITNDLKLLKDFTSLRLSPRDYKEYISRKRDFNLRKHTIFLNDLAKKSRLIKAFIDYNPVIDKNLSNLEAFYKTAKRRDKAFFNNALKAMEKTNTEQAVLIAGGFHTENLMPLFKDKGYSYMVVSPKVVEETDLALYRSLIKGELSEEEKLIKTALGTLKPPALPLRPATLGAFVADTVCLRGSFARAGFDLKGIDILMAWNQDVTQLPDFLLEDGRVREALTFDALADVEGKKITTIQVFDSGRLAHTYDVATDQWSSVTSASPMGFGAPTLTPTELSGNYKDFLPGVRDRYTAHSTEEDVAFEIQRQLLGSRQRAELLKQNENARTRLYLGIPKGESSRGRHNTMWVRLRMSHEAGREGSIQAVEYFISNEFINNLARLWRVNQSLAIATIRLAAEYHEATHALPVRERVIGKDGREHDVTKAFGIQDDATAGYVSEADRQRTYELCQMLHLDEIEGVDLERSTYNGRHFSTEEVLAWLTAWSQEDGLAENLARYMFYRVAVVDGIRNERAFIRAIERFVDNPGNGIDNNLFWLNSPFYSLTYNSMLEHSRALLREYNRSLASARVSDVKDAVTGWLGDTFGTPSPAIPAGTTATAPAGMTPAQTTQIEINPERWINETVTLDDLNRDMFRDYDYRTVGEEVKPAVAFYMALVWANMALKRTKSYRGNNLKVVVGRDCRNINPDLMNAVMSGLVYAGLDVVNIAEDAPNCVSSYSWGVTEHDPIMGVFGTASHVAVPQDKVKPGGGVGVSGFKITIKGEEGSLQSLATKDIKGESRRAIEDLIANPDKIRKMAGKRQGRYTASNINENSIRIATLVGRIPSNNLNLYELSKELEEGKDNAVNTLGQWEAAASVREPLRGIKIVVDGAHTPSGPLAIEALKRLGADIVPLRDDVKLLPGVHQADPSKDSNLVELDNNIVDKNADFGIAFDLDGDRCVVRIKGEENADAPFGWDMESFPPDNLMAALLPFMSERCGYNPQALKAAGKTGVAVVRDVLGTEMVDEAGKALGIDVHQTDAGYVYLKALVRKLRNQGVVVPIYGKSSGHAWLGVSGEIENSIAFITLFSAMVAEYKEANKDSRNIVRDTVDSNINVPYKRSGRFDPKFHPSLVETLSGIAGTMSERDRSAKGIGNWVYGDGQKIPQAIVGMGRDYVVRKIREHFKEGRTFNIPDGTLRVDRVLTTYDRSDRIYRFADIRFSLNGNYIGRFIFRASSNDTNFVCSHEAIYQTDAEGRYIHTPQVDRNYEIMGGLMLAWLEQNSYSPIEEVDFKNKANVIHLLPIGRDLLAPSTSPAGMTPAQTMVGPTVIGVPAEIKEGETRVAMVPDDVEKAVKAGAIVLVETNAGIRSNSKYDDEAYKKAGAEVCLTAKEVWGRARIIKKVKEPQPEEYEYFRQGLVIDTFFHLANSENKGLINALTANGVTAIAYESVVDEHGDTPQLKDMSFVAGWIAPLWATILYTLKGHEHYAKLADRETGQLSPNMMKLLQAKVAKIYGFLKENLEDLKASKLKGLMDFVRSTDVNIYSPGNVFIIGGGDAGIKAAYMSYLLRARRITISEKNPARQEELREFFKGLRAEERVKIVGAMEEGIDDPDDLPKDVRDALVESDTIIGCVYIRSEDGSTKAPLLISERLLGKIGTLSEKDRSIIDIAADQDGNVAKAYGKYRRPYTTHGNIGRLDKFENLRADVQNMPARFGAIASPPLSAATLPMLLSLTTSESVEEMLANSPEIPTGVIMVNGRLLDRAVAEAHGLRRPEALRPGELEEALGVLVRRPYDPDADPAFGRESGGLAAGTPRGRNVLEEMRKFSVEKVSIMAKRDSMMLYLLAEISCMGADETQRINAINALGKAKITTPLIQAILLNVEKEGGKVGERAQVVRGELASGGCMISSYNDIFQKGEPEITEASSRLYGAIQEGSAPAVSDQIRAFAELSKRDPRAIYRMAEMLCDMQVPARVGAAVRVIDEAKIYTPVIERLLRGMKNQAVGNVPYREEIASLHAEVFRTPSTPLEEVFKEEYLLVTHDAASMAAMARPAQVGVHNELSVVAYKILGDDRRIDIKVPGCSTFAAEAREGLTLRQDLVTKLNRHVGSTVDGFRATPEAVAGSDYVKLYSGNRGPKDFVAKFSPKDSPRVIARAIRRTLREAGWFEQVTARWETAPDLSPPRSEYIITMPNGRTVRAQDANDLCNKLNGLGMPGFKATEVNSGKLRLTYHRFPQAAANKRTKEFVIGMGKEENAAIQRFITLALLAANHIYARDVERKKHAAMLTAVKAGHEDRNITWVRGREGIDAEERGPADNLINAYSLNERTGNLELVSSGGMDANWEAGANRNLDSSQVAIAREAVEQARQTAAVSAEQEESRAQEVRAGIARLRRAAGKAVADAKGKNTALADELYEAAQLLREKAAEIETTLYGDGGVDQALELLPTRFDNAQAQFYFDKAGRGSVLDEHRGGMSGDLTPDQRAQKRFALPNGDEVTIREISPDIGDNSEALMSIFLEIFESSPRAASTRKPTEQVISWCEHLNETAGGVNFLTSDFTYIRHSISDHGQIFYFIINGVSGNLAIVQFTTARGAELLTSDIPFPESSGSLEVTEGGLVISYHGVPAVTISYSDILNRIIRRSEREGALRREFDESVELILSDILDEGSKRFDQELQWVEGKEGELAVEIGPTGNVINSYDVVDGKLELGVTGGMAADQPSGVKAREGLPHKNAVKVDKVLPGHKSTYGVLRKVYVELFGAEPRARVHSEVLNWPEHLNAIVGEKAGADIKKTGFMLIRKLAASGNRYFLVARNNAPALSIIELTPHAMRTLALNIPFPENEGSYRTTGDGLEVYYRGSNRVLRIPFGDIFDEVITDGQIQQGLIEEASENIRRVDLNRLITMAKAKFKIKRLGWVKEKEGEVAVELIGEDKAVARMFKLVGDIKTGQLELDPAVGGMAADQGSSVVEVYLDSHGLIDVDFELETPAIAAHLVQRLGIEGHSLTIAPVAPAGTIQFILDDAVVASCSAVSPTKDDLKQAIEKILDAAATPTRAVSMTPGADSSAAEAAGVSALPKPLNVLANNIVYSALRLAVTTSPLYATATEEERAAYDARDEKEVKAKLRAALEKEYEDIKAPVKVIAERIGSQSEKGIPITSLLAHAGFYSSVQAQSTRMLEALPIPSEGETATHYVPEELYNQNRGLWETLEKYLNARADKAGAYRVKCLNVADLHTNTPDELRDGIISRINGSTANTAVVYLPFSTVQRLGKERSSALSGHATLVSYGSIEEDTDGLLPAVLAEGLLALGEAVRTARRDNTIDEYKELIVQLYRAITDPDYYSKTFSSDNLDLILTNPAEFLFAVVVQFRRIEPELGRWLLEYQQHRLMEIVAELAV